ncbi:MAG: hypothetical protein ACO1RX_16555 [Candidatus Sericytochromatia bacterium]
MTSMINWQAIRKRQAHRLGLDLFMLGLALLHLLLLGFDLSYFALRPFYLQHAPGWVAAYDPFKGVEPHRDTEAYLQKARAFLAACPDPARTGPAQRVELVQLSNLLVEEDPFARVGLSGKLEILKGNLRSYTGVTHSSKAAFAAFWNAGCRNLTAKTAFFEDKVAPYLAQNYWRRIGTNGRFVDYFFWVDLAFVLVFLSEFLLSWIAAVRRQGRSQRVIYPIYHWYDLVSCIPLPQLRILRLLRLLSVYIRLVRSGIISLEHTWLYQQIMKYQRIIMEEISDQVAVNILTNIQAKTRLGGSRELLEDTLQAYRSEIRDVIVANLQRLELPTLETRQLELVDTLADLIMQSIRATDDYRQLTALPLVRPLVESLLNESRIAHLTEQAMDAFLEAWQQKLRSPEMQDLLRDVIDDVLDQAIRLSLDDRIQQLIEDLSIKVLEELKESSTHSKLWRAEEQALIQKKLQEKQGEANNP